MDLEEGEGEKLEGGETKGEIEMEGEIVGIFKQNDFLMFESEEVKQKQSSKGID